LVSLIRPFAAPPCGTRALIVAPASTRLLFPQTRGSLYPMRYAIPSPFARCQFNPFLDSLARPFRRLRQVRVLLRVSVQLTVAVPSVLFVSRIGWSRFDKPLYQISVGLAIAGTPRWAVPCYVDLVPVKASFDPRLAVRCPSRCSSLPSPYFDGFTLRNRGPVPHLTELPRMTGHFH